jgi:chromosome segregation ATPase
MDVEIHSKQAELERAVEQHVGATTEAKQLRAAATEREQELRLESERRLGEIDDLRRGLDEAKQNHLGEIDDLRRGLDEASQIHRDEQGRLVDQLRVMREQLEAEQSKRAAKEARVAELQDSLEKLDVEHRHAIELERSKLTAELQSSFDLERARHNKEVEELKSGAQESAQLASRMKSEVLSLANRRSEPDVDLEAARQEIADLRKKLADTETSKRSLSSLLEGMGIRLH